MAGLLAAWKNDEGIAGVAPLASVLPLPAIDNCGEGRIADVLEAFAWAGSDSLPIVVGSFVTERARSRRRSRRRGHLVSPYVDAYPDTLLVVAAGNEGANVDDPGNAVYPCSNDAPNIICVGMSDGTTSRLLVQRRRHVGGPLRAGRVHLRVGRADHGARLPGSRSGTSMSAPLVAGAAALIKGKPNTLSADLIKEALLDGVDGFGPLGTSRCPAGG